MGCAASRSSFSEDVVPNPFVTEPEQGARRSEQCAAVILCMWSKLSVAPLPLRCPSFYLPVLAGPLLPLYLAVLVTGVGRSMAISHRRAAISVGEPPPTDPALPSYLNRLGEGRRSLW
jgi:hypothetical protein